ncbi:MAG: hypothetical protein RXR41_01090 [Candidatus Marsarchaeota archaeon]
MEGDGDRATHLRYSGLLVFASKITTAFTGLYFMWILARNLTQQEFGGVYFINGVLAFFLFFSGVIPYWSSREVAVRKGGAYVSLLSNLFLSLPFTLVYLGLAGMFSAEGHVPYLAVLVAAPIISLTFLLSSTNGSINALNPASLAGTELAGDLLKIVLALFLVVSLKLGLVGAEASISAAYLASAVYSFRSLRKLAHENVMWDVRRVARWLSLSWLIAASSVVSYFYNGLDKFLLGLISEPALGAYGMALLLASQLNPVSSISTALYPHVLRAGGEDKKASRDLLALTLTFSVPMLFGLVFFSVPLLSVFSRKYAQLSALPLFSLAAAYFISSTFFSFLDSLIYGGERVDIGVRDLFRSKFFQGFLMQLVVLAVMIPVMWEAGLKFGALGMSIAVLIGALLKLLGRLLIAGKRASGVFPHRTFFNSLVSASLMSAVLVCLPHGRSLLVIAEVFLGAAIYFGLMYLLDRQFRGYAFYVRNKLVGSKRRRWGSARVERLLLS